MGLPKRINILEVGPREGFQFEKEKAYSTYDKKLLIDALSETGVPAIEVTSFVNPKAVPQMADAEELVKVVKKKENVIYTAIYLNKKGFERGLQLEGLQLEGLLNLSATDSFSRHNCNKPLSQAVAEVVDEAAYYRQKGLSELTGVLMAAFGCNYEGKVPLNKVMELIESLIESCSTAGCRLAKVQLSDTMGWANPEQIKGMVDAVWSKWPELKISMHLHDTRGTGLANAYAALQMGVDDFHAAIGGLGGCPFGGLDAFAGNICTEDLVFMCHEMGVETGINLEMYIQCALMAEKIIGRQLPGKVMRSRSLCKS